jgi:hypothetical protein
MSLSVLCDQSSDDYDGSKHTLATHRHLRRRCRHGHRAIHVCKAQADQEYGYRQSYNEAKTVSG